ncbi:MAG TPA: flagellar biosynthetic protein FliO [Acidobacteriaceae bacterium]|jgi:flagellar biogenesis protein FliO|nr:flagellar biosynthetic protein FliO [Acidobacteriaceae bacterium]
MATAAQWTLAGQQEGRTGFWLRWIRGLVKASTGVDGALRVEGRISLGPKKSLVLVNCLGRQVLLAVSGDAVTPVMELSGRPRKAKP